MRRLVGAVLIIFVLLVGTVGVVSAAGDTEVSVSPSNETVSVGTAQTFDIVVENASEDVKGYAMNLSLSNRSAGSIQGISPTGVPTAVTDTTDGTTATVEAVYLSSNQSFASDSPVVATVTVAGIRSGQTNLSLSVEEVVADLEGNQYTVTGTNAANVSVTPSTLVLPGQTNPAANLDDDPQLEDVDGDGDGDIFDALTYYNARKSPVVKNTPTAFDYDGNGDVGTIFDTLELYNEFATGTR